MKYSISRNGQVIGSYTEEEIRGYIQAGRIIGTDYALPEGGQQWIPVSQLSFASAGSVPGAPRPPVSTMASNQAKPSSNLVWAILATLFCCLPLGIVAIVFAAQVDSKYNSGDYAGAQDASKKAALFSWISLGIGLLGGVAWGIMMAIGAAAGR